MGNKKDINLLPEEYRFASSRPSSDKRKDDGGIKEVGNSIKGLMDIISSKVSSLQNEKVKGFNSNTTKSLKIISAKVYPRIPRNLPAYPILWKSQA